MLRSTGDPRIDALIAANPLVGRWLARELNYGQTRWAEVWLAGIMTVFGAVLVAPGDTFDHASFRVIESFVPDEDLVGWISVTVGIARLVAIWYNGSRRRSPLVRVLGSAGGFLFYLALFAGFLPIWPLSTGLIYGVLAIAELHSSGRAARDTSILDSLGLRQRRRDRDRLAPGG